MAGLLSDRIIGVESGGDATAKNPRSSATGAGQFIESTWLDMIGKHRPDLAGLPRDQVLALRNDAGLSRQMTQAYADENAAGLRAAGLPVNDGTQYLAHFAGLGGARSALSADPSTPVANVLPASSIRANPFLQGWTAGDLTSWAARKMGSAAPAMTMPGEAARSGQFGVSGVQASPAAAPTMTMPAAAGGGTDASNPLLSQVMQSLLNPQAAPAASAAPVQQQAAPLRPSMMTAPQQPARFDPGRFYALLGLRR
ncbi:UNVERIFIED_ORG: hypothetical protein J2W74_005242 [Methylorubrum zatmanii]